jgi:hypothetical protein
VFENRVLTGTFGPKRDEVTGEWRRLQNDEISDLYYSPNIRVINSSSMKWERHEELRGRGKVCTGLGGGETDFFEDTGVGGRITLTWAWIELSGSE